MRSVLGSRAMLPARTVGRALEEHSTRSAGSADRVLGQARQGMQ